MEDTQEIESVDSLADDLAAAFDSADETEEVTEEVTEEETEDEDSEEVETEEDEPEEGDEETLEAPQHWAAEDRELFSTLDKTGQEFLLRRHKDMEADYTRKTQEVASVKKLKEQLDEILSPHRNVYQTQGLDDLGAIRQMFAIEQNIRSNPKETLLWLAQQYGVDLNQPEQEIDPANRQIMSEIEQLKQAQYQQQRSAQHEQVQALQSQIESFANEKDGAGNVKHPHFETVRVNMGKFIQAGLATDLPSAYEMAIRHDPDLQRQIQESAEKEAKAKKAKEKAAAAAKAKKAASGVKSTGTADKGEPASLRDEISSLYDQMS